MGHDVYVLELYRSNAPADHQIDEPPHGGTDSDWNGAEPDRRGSDDGSRQLVGDSEILEVIALTI